MIVEPVATRLLHPPQDDLLGALAETLPQPPERSVLAVTSKVVSIWEGRCVAEESVADKDDLIRAEADRFLPRDATPNRWVMHTIKRNVLIPTSGIDESNAGGYYVLWPLDPSESARRLRDWLRQRYGVEDLGVVITDSHSIPLRRGTLGISLAHAGFAPINDYRGELDLFGRPLRISMANVADSLAVAAVAVMGEGQEGRPAALIRDVPFVSFGDAPVATDRPYSTLEVAPEEDLYAPFLSSVPWEKGEGGFEIRP